MGAASRTHDSNDESTLTTKRKTWREESNWKT